MEKNSSNGNPSYFGTHGFQIAGWILAPAGSKSSPPSSLVSMAPAFERVCFNHIRQIKKALQIGGVSTTHSEWIRQGDAEEGAQIDLIISRGDNVMNMCELKFYSDDFSVNNAYYRTILKRQEILRNELSPKVSIQSTLVTTFGLAKGEYESAFSNVVTLEDLFAEV